MKKIIKLTESDLTIIVKRVINENNITTNYFKRRGIDVNKLFYDSMEKINPCKYAKLATYFNKVFEKFIISLYLNSKTFKEDLENETISIEHDIHKFVVNEYGDFIWDYYVEQCGKNPK